EPLKALQRFADNFEFALDCTSKKTVTRVFGKTFSGRVLKNTFAGLAHVKQQLFRRDGHREPCEWPERSRENMDCESSVLSPNQLGDRTTFPRLGRGQDNCLRIRWAVVLQESRENPSHSVQN